MTLIYLGIAWLAGIFLSSLLNLPALFLTVVGLVPLVSLFLWGENRQVRLASACALALLLGAWRYASAIPHFDEGSLAYYNKTSVWDLW